MLDSGFRLSAWIEAARKTPVMQQLVVRGAAVLLCAAS